MQLIFLKNKGRNTYSAGPSLHLACTDVVWSNSKPAWVYHISTLPYTKQLEARARMSKPITCCANSKAATQSNQESNLDMEFLARNSTSKQILSCL